MVLDILQLATDGSFCFSWISRAANKVPHVVAALALRNWLPCNWISNPPLNLVSVSEMDINYCKRL